jgi:predicted amidohydrolase YtcJ
LLSADPRGRPPLDVHAITTDATIVGGRVVYDRT